MPAIGGSIETINLDGRDFAVAFDAEVQRKLGGFENENMLNGNGTARLIKTRVGWSLAGATIEINDDRGDQEFLQDLTDLNDYFPVNLTYASGVTYQGSGQIVGENPASSQSATAAIELAGPGVLSRQ